MNNPFLVIDNRLSRIEEILLDLKYQAITPTPAPADEFLNLQQASELLSIAPQTIYQNIKKIPHHKRFGKLFFRRSELVKYVEEGAQQNKKGGKQ